MGESGEKGVSQGKRGRVREERGGESGEEGVSQGGERGRVDDVGESKARKVGTAVE